MAVAKLCFQIITNARFPPGAVANFDTPLDGQLDQQTKLSR